MRFSIAAACASTDWFASSRAGRSGRHDVAKTRIAEDVVVAADSRGVFLEVHRQGTPEFCSAKPALYLFLT